MKPITYSFPKNFTWGVATAATQIEGAAAEDGKGPSIWDHFSTFPGNIANGDTPAVACDHYHRYPEDFALMRRMGVKNYRFSTSWPRIVPDASGALNERGLDFYERLVDSMLDHEITPWCTLYHWELPLWMEEKGGWPDRGVVPAFARYAEAIVRRLGDRVKRWFTINELNCFIYLGYQSGQQAPFRRVSPALLARAHHHALLVHGEAVAAVRAHGGRGAKVGFALNPGVPVPFTETDTDITAARNRFEEVNGGQLGPILTGKYNAWHLAQFGTDMPAIQPGDMELIAQPIDFVGLNVYTGSYIRADAEKGFEDLPYTNYAPRADASWLYAVPESLYWIVRHIHDIYGPQDFYITENGASYPAGPDEKNRIFDTDRVQFLRSYLKQAHRLTQEGLGLRGYFHWSFMDNFEWSMGYSQRFGLVHVDYATQRRTPKLSADWFSRVVAENRVL